MPANDAQRNLGAGMRISRNGMLMQMAKLAAQRGTCRRRSVGAVIARDGRVLSIGYVGAPAGFPHCTPDICGPDKPCERTIHAEANAIAFAAKEGIRLEDSTLYTTASPCLHCAKLIINSGITTVWYDEEYRDVAPIELLEQAGILCAQLPPEKV